ncbi:alpha/beta hydrolase [Vibrio splendidus]|nr:alpha/beta fold hydrolase [Vibrio splendidus]UOE90462.1 alpha/beta hydrolase [Vibrio splendidus]
MKRASVAIMLSIGILSLLGCSIGSAEPEYYRNAQSLPDFKQETFQHYVTDSQAWLREERFFITHDKDREIQLNLPKEYRQKDLNGIGILLVHGLGDSPFSFSDIAEDLSSRGYLVRTMLLPGHGTKVGDLKLVSEDIWQTSVEHQISLLQKEVGKIWLGGYSTGANLVTSYALTQDEVDGLLLFSPAFKPQSKLAPFATWAQYLVTWADQDIENNYLRYESLPMRAAASYIDTTKQVQTKLEATGRYDKPVFMLISEGDNVIDKSYATSHFSHTFIHPQSQLVWLGDTPPADKRASAFTMDLPDLNISEGSHMGGLFSPNNIEYGTNGVNRICSNGQSAVDEERCLTGDEVWFSSYGFIEQGKIHARLTYNPYFDQTMVLMSRVLDSSITQ